MVRQAHHPEQSRRINLKFQYPTRGASACAARDQNRIKKRTSNIEPLTSNVELAYAFGVSILLKKRSEATPTFDVERSMLDVHL